MFINPIIAINNKWITHPQCKSVEDFRQRKFLSPNGIDFTVDGLLMLLRASQPTITEYIKKMRSLVRVNLSDSINTNEMVWKLNRGITYDATSEFYVDIPEGVAAYLLTRSTFIRNGVFIQSGLFDAGFKGNIGHIICPFGGDIEIAPGTRIGQIIFVKADQSGILYAGGYNTKDGQHWAEMELEM